VTPPECLVVVKLTVRSLVDFERFERAAAAIWREHGARIVTTVRFDADPIEELHVVCFPNRAAFDAYRSDPALLALVSLRDAAIARTELQIGVAGPSYEVPSVRP
jgi:uncharacterized protein (DUF1330 family)